MGLIEVIIILLFLIYLIYLIYINKKRKRCNLKVSGKVIARWTEEYGRFRNDPVNKGYRTYIIVEYEYNQKKYDKEIVISPFELIKVNDEAEVMINPLNPAETHGVYFSREKIRERMKLKEYVVRWIVLIPIIVIIGFLIYFVVVILLDEFRQTLQF